MSDIYKANNRSPDNERVQYQLQQILEKLQLDGSPAGGSLVVFHKGKCIVQASVGLANFNKPWSADTLSLNFSKGKGILATLIHVLVSEKLLQYDSAIADYWPAFSAKGKAQITLREVLSHQADLFAISSIEADHQTLLDWQTMLIEVAAMPITPPDNAAIYDSAYSALVYGWILGGLIEKVTNMSLAAALETYVTQPLGIAGSCYFGVPKDRVGDVATLSKHFEMANKTTSKSSQKSNKPLFKADSVSTLQTYAELPSYQCWQQLAVEQGLVDLDTPLIATLINRLYFDHSAINAKNYRAALIPIDKQPLDYYHKEVLQAIIPAANGVASARALATIYAMLANGGVWQGKTLIDATTFAQLSMPQVHGMDAVMPASMEWRLGYHRLFSVCQMIDDNDVKTLNQQGFGHMGYNGSVAWCDPTRQLSFAFVHNFETTMLTDSRQFALTEALLSLIDAEAS